MITKSELKQRGWTDKLIKNLLPSLDQIKTNPHYKNAPPMQLFDLERVIKLEETEEFKLKQINKEKRKLASQKAVETKLDKLYDWIDNLVIKVPYYKKQKLLKLACQHYNEMQLDRQIEGRSFSDCFADLNSNQLFLERICVNYLRHCLTDYEELLDEMKGRTGFNEGYYQIRNLIFDAISEKYDWLQNECNRQKSYK